MILFKNYKSLIAPMLILGLGLVAILSIPILPLQDPTSTALENRLLPIGSDKHLFGTDLLGRDNLARLLYGLRLSVIVALAAATLATLIGGFIGLIAGYFKGWTDGLLMRGIDLLMAFPYLILALSIVAILGPGLFNALLAISIVNIPFFARTTRGLTISVANQPFVESARLSGESHFRIICFEIIPNILPMVLVTFVTTFGWMLLETAGLSFLGLGAQPPFADLGSMLAENRKLMLVAPHVALLPGLLIFMVAGTTNIFGDRLRDVIDQNPVESATPPKSIHATTHTQPLSAPGALLALNNLRISFQKNSQTLTAVNNLDLTINPGESLAIVGESGSGKSITAMSIAGLLPKSANWESGSLFWKGKRVPHNPNDGHPSLLGKEISIIFQDPLLSLNPLMKVGSQIAESAKIHGVSPKKAKESAIEWMKKVGIPQAENRFFSYPHQLSGGQRQRICIALALINKPSLLIADEPTTALDVTVQRKLIETLKELIKESGTSLLFISHDLAVVSDLCRRTMVMKNGRLIESAPTVDILESPKSSYTKHLIDCIPKLHHPEELLPSREFKEEA